MISRLAFKGLLQRELLSRSRLAALCQSRGGTTNAAVALPSIHALSKEETHILGHSIESLEKVTIDEMDIAAPKVVGIEREAFSSMEDIKKNNEPLEDQMAVWFGRDMPTILDDQKPERDLVNFPREIRPIEAVPVRMGFIPDAWFRFFYDKTGVTGPYVFGVGFVTYLLSKEIYVIGHGTPSGISLIFWTTVFMKTLGKQFKNYIERVHLAEERGWILWQQGSIKALEDYIDEFKHNQEAVKNEGILFDAKRENIHMQREAEFRRRMAEVYSEAKRKLDYQLAMQETQKQFAQKHMVNWIIDSVVKGITPEQEKNAFSQSIIELKKLSAQRANVI